MIFCFVAKRGFYIVMLIIEISFSNQLFNIALDNCNLFIEFVLFLHERIVQSQYPACVFFRPFKLVFSSPFVVPSFNTPSHFGLVFIITHKILLLICEYYKRGRLSFRIRVIKKNQKNSLTPYREMIVCLCYFIAILRGDVWKSS